MTNPLPDEVRAAIHRAWQASQPPPPDRISAPTYDDEGVAAYFRGRTWQNHEVATLRYHGVISFVSRSAKSGAIDSAKLWWVIHNQPFASGPTGDDFGKPSAL
jgi:hypothetical protein